jgi:hypothetical protein
MMESLIATKLKENPCMFDQLLTISLMLNIKTTL